MSLDRDTRKQLIEARERIKAQLNEDDATAFRARADSRPVYAELEEQRRQIDDLLGIDPDKYEEEPGDDNPDAAAAAAAAEPDYQRRIASDTDANALASRVIVDDASTWDLSRTVLIVPVLAVVIAVAFVLAKRSGL